MKKALFLTITALTMGIMSCADKESKSSPAPSALGISGQFINGFTNTTTGDNMFFTLTIGGGSVDARVYFFPGGSMTTGYYHKNVGSYTVSGNAYQFNYDHETCEPVGSEAVEITTIDSEKVSMTGQGTEIIFYKQNIAQTLNAEGMQISIEDTECNKF